MQEIIEIIKKIWFDLISTIIDKIDNKPKLLQFHAPILLNNLKIILSFRENVVTQSLYPLLHKLIQNENILNLHGFEEIYNRINQDAFTLIHSVGKQDLRERK